MKHILMVFPIEMKGEKVMTNEEELLSIVKEDARMMQVLKIVKSLNLPDWWVCAGFVRSKIWDRQHGFDRASPLPDMDVIYFDRDHR